MRVFVAAIKSKTNKRPKKKKIKPQKNKIKTNNTKK
jgi:hypothetical protein